MQTSDLPSLIPVPFAQDGTKNVIPTEASPTPGRASLTLGFPPETMIPIVAGGKPPLGNDFNGILYSVTQAIRWGQAGGQYRYDAAFSAAVGGYPKGAILAATTGNGRWLNLVDNNTSNPDAGGANWVPLGMGIATTAQAQALSDDSVVLTPKKLKDAFSLGLVLSSSSINQSIAGGPILKAGSFNGVSGLVTFPTPFPTACVAILGAESAVPGAGTTDFVLFQCRDITRFGFSPELRNKMGEYPPAATIRYLAIGY